MCLLIGLRQLACVWKAPDAAVAVPDTLAIEHNALLTLLDEISDILSFRLYLCKRSLQTAKGKRFRIGDDPSLYIADVIVAVLAWVDTPLDNETWRVLKQCALHELVCRTQQPVQPGFGQDSAVVVVPDSSDSEAAPQDRGHETQLVATATCEGEAVFNRVHDMDYATLSKKHSCSVIAGPRSTTQKCQSPSGDAADSDSSSQQKQAGNPCCPPGA